MSTESDLILKYEKLLSHIYEACLCQRFKTKGFDYSEKHPRLESEVGCRHNTPRDMIEGTVGVKWKYKDKEKPGNSWQELQFKEYKGNIKEGYY